MLRDWSPGPKSKDLEIAEQNLGFLFEDLPQGYRAVVDRNRIKFKWHNRKSTSGVSDYDRKTIELSLMEFSRFKYDATAPGHDQRWCIATLKEEIIHFVAMQTGFDASAAWIAAAVLDMEKPSKLRKKLFRKQREYDSAEDEIKCGIEDYKKKERAGEWLVDVLLVRDYLTARGKSEEKIEQKMTKAFPESYPLARAFQKATLSDGCG
ncbi:MAG: hypothetical protein R3D67_18860 [Hyphomicrobiaceae bacterium]